MISRTRAFGTLVRKANALMSRVYAPKLTNYTGDIPSAPIKNREKFDALSEQSKIELISAIKSLQLYTNNSKKSVSRHRKLFKMMAWRQQKICEEVGYLKRLNQVEQLIGENQQTLDDIAKSAIYEYGIDYKDMQELMTRNSNASSSNYRVIEAFGHFIRDWNEVGECEVSYLHNFLQEQLDSIIPKDKRSKTCIVIPGSGLGGVGHFIAQMEPQFAAVHAVEYSGLMHICNKFMYKNGSKESKLFKDSYNIYPYIHTNSNFTKTENQYRKIEFQRLESKPNNLELHHEDFRYFQIPHLSKYENVVVLSVFFVDTAENLIDYLDAIKTLTTPSKANNIQNGYWINIGPLKYGSAAQVELTAQEFARVRSKMGWKDKYYENSVDFTNKEKLVGYITDKQSMWQGYYGLSMWNSSRIENKHQK